MSSAPPLPLSYPDATPTIPLGTGWRGGGGGGGCFLTSLWAGLIELGIGMPPEVPASPSAGLSQAQSPGPWSQGVNMTCRASPASTVRLKYGQRVQISRNICHVIIQGKQEHHPHVNHHILTSYFEQVGGQRGMRVSKEQQSIIEH